MFVEERRHQLRLVGGQVVEDHVDLLIGLAGYDHFPQETDEVLARVPSRRLAHHVAGLDVQRGVERQRAVPLVLESVALDAAGRQRQHTVSAVERLNGGLLIDAEHRRVTGRVQVEPDDVRRLGLEVGVGRGHVARQPMRPQLGLPPDALADVLAHAEVSCEAAARPVRRSIRRRAIGGSQHPGTHPRRQLPRCAPPIAARQALHAVLGYFGRTGTPISEEVEHGFRRKWNIDSGKWNTDSGSGTLIPEEVEHRFLGS